MILSNNTTTWEFVNGDCGYVEDMESNAVYIRVVRTGGTARIEYIKRYNEVMYKPWLEGKSWWVTIGRREAFVIGEIEYMPVRLAWATTVHKSQGLTLDKVQIDIQDSFFGSPNLAYVALSRCRTPEGMTLVGTPTTLEHQINLADEVVPWV